MKILACLTPPPARLPVFYQDHLHSRSHTIMKAFTFILATVFLPQIITNTCLNPLYLHFLLHVLLWMVDSRNQNTLFIQEEIMLYVIFKIIYLH